jgi:hypothetical protein
MIKRTITPALACCALFATARLEAQSTIADWTFDNLTVGSTSVNPAPSSGSGTAASFGMAAYGTGPDTSNIYSDAGSSTGGPLVWRVVGNNGWNNTAPIGTQGAEFDVNTTGFDNIQLSFDWQATSKGEANLQVEYNLNVNNGSGWENVALTYGGPQTGGTATVLNNTISANTVNGTYLQLLNDSNNTWWNGIQVNLGSIAGASNDSTFGVRIVNASTGADDIIASSTSATPGTGENNTSGNWRFDNVDFTGDAVPEPSTLALVGVGLAGLIGIRRRKNS